MQELNTQLGEKQERHAQLQRQLQEAADALQRTQQACVAAEGEAACREAELEQRLARVEEQLRVQQEGHMS